MIPDVYLAIWFSGCFLTVDKTKWLLGIIIIIFKNKKNKIDKKKKQSESLD